MNVLYISCTDNVFTAIARYELFCIVSCPSAYFLPKFALLTNCSVLSILWNIHLGVESRSREDGLLQNMANELIEDRFNGFIDSKAMLES